MTDARQKWDERYSAPGFAYGTKPNDFLAEAVTHFKRELRVLSLAEGEGRNAIFMAKLGHQVTAVDISPIGLDKAKKLATENSVVIDTVVSDVFDFDFAENSYDAVVSIWLHLTRNDWQKLFSKCRESLKPGGFLVLEAYTPGQLKHGTGGPKDIELLAPFTQLRENLSGFEIVIGRELEREIHEGHLHDGMSAVVQILARKLD